MSVIALHSEEWNCEEVCIQKMGLHADLLGIECRHYEKQGQAIVEGIIMKGTKGEQDLGGCKPFNVTVEATFTTATMEPDAADKILKAMTEAMYLDDSLFAPDVPDLEFLSLEPQCESLRENTKKLRKRIVKFPFLAKLVSS